MAPRIPACSAPSVPSNRPSAAGSAIARGWRSRRGARSPRGFTARYPLAPALSRAFLLDLCGGLWRWPVAVSRRWCQRRWRGSISGCGRAGGGRGIGPRRARDRRRARWCGRCRGAPISAGAASPAQRSRWPALRRRGRRGARVVLARPAEGVRHRRARPDNALRVAKGFAIALALLPFLRRALAERGDAPRLFGAGMAAGLALVAAAAMYERHVFTGTVRFRRRLSRRRDLLEHAFRRRLCRHLCRDGAAVPLRAARPRGGRASAPRR